LYRPGVPGAATTHVCDAVGRPHRVFDRDVLIIVRIVVEAVS